MGMNGEIQGRHRGDIREIWVRVRVPSDGRRAMGVVGDAQALLRARVGVGVRGRGITR